MKKKIILVIYDPSLDSDILRARIKSLGPSYTFWDNHWFVKTSLTTDEIYKKVSDEEFKTTALLVVELSENQNSYYGRMNPSLWEWFKK